jgi:hypothetical protein
VAASAPVELGYFWMIVHRIFAHPASVALALLLTSLFFVNGCGGQAESAHLAGNVTVGGEPLPDDVVEARISFMPTENGRGPTSGAQIVDGRYDVPAGPLGEVKVFFGITRKTGKMIQDSRGPVEEVVSLVPSETMNQTIEVEGDNLNLDFDL